MAPSAVRLTAYAGVLAAGVLMSGMSGGIAVADGGDSTSSGPHGTSTRSNVGDSAGATGGKGGAADKPTSTVGSGREEKKPVVEPGSKSNSSRSIPALPQPNPAPTQAPSFRTQEEAPAFRTQEEAPAFRTQEEAPVVDAGGAVSDGSDALSATTGEPPVLKAPLVVAPPPALPPPALFPSSVPVASIGASAGGPGPRPVATEAQGAKPPLARGTVQQTTETGSSGDLSLTPLSGQATRVGYPRFFRTPTLRDLAALALPGVGGLLFLTFSGGFLGYRQANSLRFIRMQGAERFLR